MFSSTLLKRCGSVAYICILVLYGYWNNILFIIVIDRSNKNAINHILLKNPILNSGDGTKPEMGLVNIKNGKWTMKYDL